MLQHLRNRLTPRTLLFALLAVLGVAVMAFSSLKVNQRQHDAGWEAQPATPSAGAIPAQENALIGGMRHNRDTMIEQQHALAEVRQTLALLQAENAELKARLTETQHQLSLASGSGHDDSLNAEETRQLIAEQMQFMRQTLAEQNPPAPPPAPPPEQILDAPAERLPAYEPPEPLRDWVRIPDRSTATAVTISGSAGQASGEPFPVNVQIESDLTGPGPAYTRIPLSGCRVGAEGIVQAVPARSLFRIKSLSCTFTLADGRIQPVEVEARGWLTGPDNINGGLAQIFHNEGEIYKRFGQAAVPVALVSLLEETREVVHTLSPLGLVTTIGNDVVQQVAGEIATFYIDKAREYFDPLAWVPDNQRVYVHFDGGVTLPIERHAIRRPYAALANRYSAYR